MSNLVEIKKRIESISSTIKVTKVMQMIATSKVAKIKTKISLVDKYNNISNEILSNFIKNTSNPTQMEKYFSKDENKTYKNVLLVILSSDKGTCGAINTNLFKELHKIVKEYQNNGSNVSILTIGKKAFKFIEANAEKLKINIYNLENKQADAENCDGNIINSIVKQIVKGYDEQKFDAIHFVFNKFKNIITCNVVNAQILPFNKEEINLDNSNFTNVEETDETGSSFVEFFVRTKLYNAYISNLASIVSSRMNAMDNATKNGQDIIDDLRIKFNKGRQAHITSELSDIVSGFEAIS